MNCEHGDWLVDGNGHQYCGRCGEWRYERPPGCLPTVLGLLTFSLVIVILASVGLVTIVRWVL